MTYQVKVDWTKLDKLLKDVPDRSDIACGQIARDIVQEIKGNWSPSSPSEPGNPPAVVTGTLNRSVKSEARDFAGRFASDSKGSKWYVRVGDSEAYYAGFLEFGTSKMVERPFFIPAIERVQDKLPDYFSGIFDTIKGSIQSNFTTLVGMPDE